MSLANGTRLGPYEITAQIGSGGMGEVYKALDTRLNRFVAIKTSREKYGERFEREMRAIAALNHPNICSLYDVGPDHLVMELLEGQTLQQLLQSRRLTTEESIRIAEQMAEALHAAHSKGITHRDIKPGNIFVSPRGHVKVLDFGLAKLASEPRGPDEETQTMGSDLSTPGQAMGTAAYMAPEQARGMDLDARVDLWAMGVVFYEMLTGSRPFDGTTLALVYDAILNKPAALGEVPADLQPIVSRLLEKDRERRYQSAAVVQEDLDRLLSGSLPSTSQTGTWPKSDPAGTTPQSSPHPSSTRSGPTAPAEPPISPPAAKRSRWRRYKWPVFIFIAYGLLSRCPRDSEPPSSSAPPTDNRFQVVIGEFANRTQDPVWNNTLREALTAHMQDSDAFLPLSPNQTGELLQDMKRDPKEPLAPELAQEVCNRADGYAALNGTITQIGSTYALLVTASSCENGQLLASTSGEAASKEKVLDTLQAMAFDLRQKMTGPIPPQERWRFKAGGKRPRRDKAPPGFGEPPTRPR